MKITEILGTKYQDKSFKKEKDFFAKYFTRPFLTKKAIKHRPIKVKVNKKGLPENMDKIFKRDQLPQWTAKKLSQSDHNFVKKVVNFDWIKPVQVERVEGLKDLQVNAILEGSYMPMVVDRNGYIVNGHHRYDALYELGLEEVKVIIIDEDIDNLVDNFADGKKPGRKGISKRVGIPKGATMAQLQKYAKSKGEKGRMARWQLNMRRGRKKKKK
jgi:hypothetical protein